MPENRAFGVEGIPTPPGVGDPNDPLYRTLRIHLGNGPEIKLFYDWAQQIRDPHAYPDEASRQSSRDAWKETLRNAIINRMSEKKQ